MPANAKKYRIVESWTASYPDPLYVKTGEPIILTGESDIWNGHQWLWAKDPRGKEGWIPDSLVLTGNPSTARTDYSAVELTCQAGETVLASTSMHGWMWCQAGDGRTGWVPITHLAITPHQ